MCISLNKAAVWLPEGRQTAAEISAISGVPEPIVREKMGIVAKCRARPDEHPSEMAIRAASKVLDGIDPLSIDLVIWTGSEYKDYPVWSAGIFVQGQLGLKRAWSFDLAARCSSNLVGIKVAKAMMEADSSLNRVLLCGGHRTGDLVNFKDPNARFLFNLSDGGSAIMLERGEYNPILSSAAITDGSFSRDVLIPGGGTRKPARGGLAPEDTYLTVPDIEGMRKRLADHSIANFVAVIERVCGEEGPRSIDYLGLLHMKRSAHDAVLDTLGVPHEKSVYLDHYGHFGAPDQVLSLGLAEQLGLLKPGAKVVLASAGIGYTWSAVAMRWDRPAFSNYDF